MAEKTLAFEEKVVRLMQLSREVISLSSELFRDVVAAPQKVIQKFTEILNGLGLASKILTGEKIELPKEYREKKRIEVE
jgi:hypothetical protein